VSIRVGLRTMARSASAPPSTYIYEPDPGTTVYVYISRDAIRFVVVQIVRVTDGVIVRIPHYWIQHIDESVMVEDGQSRILSRRFLNSYSEPVFCVERFVPTVATLVKRYLNEDVHVTDGVTPSTADRTEKTLQEDVDTTDGISRTVIDDLIKRSFYETASPVDAMSETSEILADLVTETLSESVSVADAIDRTVVDRIETVFPETASPTEVTLRTIWWKQVVTLEEQVRVGEGGVENPPPEDPEAEYVWWRYHLGERILSADGLNYEESFEIEADYVFTEGVSSPYNVMYDVVLTPVVAIEHSAPTRMETQRKLARMSDGTLYFVYAKKLDEIFQIYVKKSVDDGATWTGETRISTYSGMESYGQTLPAIAVDSSDHLHVVWQGYATGCTTRTQIWCAEYTDSWQTPVHVSTGMESYHQMYPAIAVDSSDHLHVVWHGNNDTYPFYYQIWYRKYTDSWGTITRLSTYSGMDDHFTWTASIAVDSQDHLHVVFDGRADGYADYTQVWHTLYDGSWHTPVRISTYSGMSGDEQGYPSIAVDSSDYLHVVWWGGATGYSLNQIWCAKRTAGWFTPVRLSTADGMVDYNQGVAVVAVDGDDAIHVLWGGLATGHTDYHKIWYSVYDGSWSTPACLHPTGQNRYPSLLWSRWP